MRSDTVSVPTMPKSIHTTFPIAHKNVAGMRVGVEEPVVEHLGHVALAHAARERVHVDTLLAQLLRCGRFPCPWTNSMTSTDSQEYCG